MPSHKSKSPKHKSNKRVSQKAKQLKIISCKNQAGGSCAPVPDVSKYYNPLNLNDPGADYTNIFERTFYPRAQNVGEAPPSCPGTVNHQANIELGKQAGGAYTFDLNDNIGNQPARIGYPDCCPPVYHNQEMHLSHNFAPMCGAGRKMKSKRKSHSKNKRSKKMKSKVSRRSHKGGSRKTKSGSKRCCPKPCKCNPCKCRNKNCCKKQSGGKKRHSRSRKQLGGGTSQDGSPYQLDGVNSNFSGNMMEREFGCRAPEWGPNCI